MRENFPRHSAQKVTVKHGCVSAHSTNDDKALTTSDDDPTTDVISQLANCPDLKILDRGVVSSIQFFKNAVTLEKQMSLSVKAHCACADRLICFSSGRGISSDKLHDTRKGLAFSEEVF